MRLSNNRKWMHRIEENLYCCWTCFKVTRGDADYWTSCDEYAHSYTHVFRICIGCYTGVGIEEHTRTGEYKCRFKEGKDPGLPLDVWTFCRQFRRGRAFQRDDGDWQFLSPEDGANYRDRYSSRYDGRYYRFVRKCSKWNKDDDK